jgi:hypothetical protein
MLEHILQSKLNYREFWAMASSRFCLTVLDEKMDIVMLWWFSQKKDMHLWPQE